MLNLARIMYLKDKGTLKGFGKTSSFYGRNWRPNMKIIQDCGGYKNVWNSQLMCDLRAACGEKVIK